jgi:thymidylate synthase
MLKMQEYIASKLNVEIGSYIDISNSLHIYGKDFKELNNVLKRIYNKNDYSYEIEGLFYEVSIFLEEIINA